MSRESPPGDDFAVIYSIMKIGSIRRSHDVQLGRTTYVVRPHGRDSRIPVADNSQAQRVIRYFGGRLEMKDLLVTSIRDEAGQLSIHYIDII